MKSLARHAAITAVTAGTLVSVYYGGESALVQFDAFMRGHIRELQIATIFSVATAALVVVVGASVDVYNRPRPPEDPLANLGPAVRAIALTKMTDTSVWDYRTEEEGPDNRRVHTYRRSSPGTDGVSVFVRITPARHAFGSDVEAWLLPARAISTSSSGACRVALAEHEHDYLRKKIEAEDARVIPGGSARQERVAAILAAHLASRDPSPSAPDRDHG